MNERKQSLLHEMFLQIREAAIVNITLEQITERAACAVEEIQRFCNTGKAAYSWSGGKDALVLGHVARMAGIQRGVLARTNLEYSAFVEWLATNTPEGVSVINTGQDLDWLVKYPDMLFPATATLGAAWFSKVQHTAQRKYYKENDLQVILLGRRRSDGNFVGREGKNNYESKGIVRYSPLADWTHAEIFAALHHFKLDLPPIYDFPRGFRVGTGPWAARQWCDSVQHGWKEVYDIEPGIVVDAAKRIESADIFLTNRG